ncbi:MAG TPA: flagellar basal body protein [Candidatus Eremiobacteraceae bacterium]|nr:flagellar basal body protein [Candidatus Eremiobacteraceae bacterium]
MSASAFDIAASGMAAHSAEMDLIAENIANAGVSKADGTEYRPRMPVFEPAGDGSFASALASALGSDPTGDFSLDPADAGDAAFGFAAFGEPAPQPVRLAGIAVSPASDGDDSIGQMVSLVAAGRAYDADVAALQAAKQMDVEAIDVDRS